MNGTSKRMGAWEHLQLKNVWPIALLTSVRNSLMEGRLSRLGHKDGHVGLGVGDAWVSGMPGC